MNKELPISITIVIIILLFTNTCSPYIQHRDRWKEGVILHKGVVFFSSCSLFFKFHLLYRCLWMVKTLHAQITLSIRNIVHVRCGILAVTATAAEEFLPCSDCL